MDARARPPGRLYRAGTACWLLTGIAAAAGVVVLLLVLLRPLLLMVLAAVAFATVAAPLVDVLVSRRVPRPIAALLCCLLVIGIVVSTAAVVIAGVADQWDEVIATLSAGADRLSLLAADTGMGRQQVSGAEQVVGTATPALLTGLLSGLASGISAAVQVVVGAVFGLYLLFFLLKDAATAGAMAANILPLPGAVAHEILARAARLVRRYFAGLTVIALANSAIVLVGVLILGVPLGAAIAMVTFVTAYIPYVGAMVSGTFAVLIALGSGGPRTAVWMLVIVILANGILQNLIQPFAFGAALNLHPLVVLLVTVLGGLLAGVAGVMLAAPTTAIIIELIPLIRRKGDPKDLTSGNALTPSGGINGTDVRER